MMDVFEITSGHLADHPRAFPIPGLSCPTMMLAHLNDNGRVLADTDWHIHELYAGLLPGASSIRALFHRYVIDANRDPEGM